MDLRDLLVVSGLNTLTFSDPYAKLVCVNNATSQSDRTLYFDLDTTFCAYAKAGYLSARAVDIYLPEAGRFIPCFKHAMTSLQSTKYSLVIFDSIGSFYSLYLYSQKTMGSVNRFLFATIMLLLRVSIDLKIPLLVTSMLRYRNERGWIQSPAARKIVERSAVKLGAEKIKDDIMVDVELHPTLKVQDKITIVDAILSHL